jgi:hypothetical protein
MRYLTAILLSFLFISNAQAEDQLDIVGYYALLTSYMNICIPKTEPPPIAKIFAVVKAARLAGINITDPLFRNEAAKRMENLTSLAPLMGTRRWCEISEHQTDVDFVKLTTATQEK